MTKQMVAASSVGLSSEISATNSDVTSLDLYIDGVSADLSSEISATNADVTSIDTYMHSDFEQQGVFATATQFTLATPVLFGGTDDMKVFINGHNIHKNGTIEGVSEGYETADGITFDLVSIGYDIDATDHVTVIAKRA